MDSNLKVGSNNVGLFVGNVEILGGGGTEYNNWVLWQFDNCN